MTTPRTIDRYDHAYMDMAERWGCLSHAHRKLVGALIVKDRQIIPDGFNGAPEGFPNACEDAEGKTLRHVLHAESNAIAKVARSTHSCEGATLYVTLSPCFECAKLIHQAGIKRVVYKEAYSDLSGVDFLHECGVIVHSVSF